MAQIPQHRGDVSQSRFICDPDHEIRYWTQRLGVSPEDVRAAMRRVRAMVAETRRSRS